MSEISPQVQPQIQFKVIKVEKRWNIKVNEIEEKLPKILLVDGKVLTYMHRTWGSCREWKLVVLTENGEFIDGEWEDGSSRKNAYKHKYTQIEQLPQRIIVYYYESPSCNRARQYSFKVLVEVVKE